MALKQVFKVGSLLGINIPYCLWKKNPDSIFHDVYTVKIQFLEYTWIYFQLSNEWKKSSVGASEEEMFRFNWRISPKNNELQLPKQYVWAYTD